MGNVSGGWRWRLDHEMPEVLVAGRGTALIVAGWLYHDAAATTGVWIDTGTGRQPVDHHSVPRVDVHCAVDGDGASHAYRSGFWAVIPIPEVEERTVVTFRLEARAATGTELSVPIAKTVITPPVPRPFAATNPSEVVICLATYNPRPDLLARQVDSIRAQTHESWRCLVGDDASDDESWAVVEEVIGGDPRFELRRSRRRRGFYFNFESLLERVPPGTRYVALADQDDEWQPQKLATLIEAIERDRAVLAYSDQRVVTASGSVLSPTFWTGRDNYYTGLRRLLAGNTVTGAAAVFRGDLLDRLLPLPPMLHSSFHDHWLAVVALASGRLTYVDQPLSDYVQHDDQVLGHDAGTGSGATKRAKPAQAARLARRAEDSYFNKVLLQRLFATVLGLRIDGSASPSRRRMLRHVAAAETTAGGVADYGVRALTERRRDTLGYHRDSFLGVGWALWWRSPFVGPPTREVDRGVHPPPGLVRYRGDHDDS